MQEDVTVLIADVEIASVVILEGDDPSHSDVLPELLAACGYGEIVADRQMAGDLDVVGQFVDDVAE